jgi:hypothetical protein
MASAPGPRRLRVSAPVTSADVTLIGGTSARRPTAWPPRRDTILTKAVRGLAAALERLRVDRQLDEALTQGPDPLHLAAVFGIDDKTAIRYATAARHLLAAPPEQHDPPSGIR